MSVSGEDSRPFAERNPRRTVAMNRFLACLLLALAPFAVIAQDSRKAITNTDVVSMTKAGLKEQTIILAIEQGPTSLDTSPQELVALKKAGVSDAVLNAMLAASKNSSDRTTSVSSGSSLTTDTSGNTEALPIVEKALNAVGAADKLKAIAATRQVSATTKSASGSTSTAEIERTAVYPDRLYLEIRTAGWPVTAVVVTPEFAYSVNGQAKTQLAPAVAGDYRTGMRFDFSYVAQHMNEFTFVLDGQETVGLEKCDRGPN